MPDKSNDQVEQIVALVKQLNEQKAAERGSVGVLEEARKAIQAKGQFIPKPVPADKAIRVCF